MPYAEPALRNGFIFTLACEPRFERARLRLHRVELRLAQNLVLHERFGATETQLRLREQRLRLREHTLCGSELRFREAQTPLDVRSIEARENLPLADLHAFVDQNFQNFSRDLGRDDRHPPRGDIARGVQDRLAAFERGYTSHDHDDRFALGLHEPIGETGNHRQRQQE